MEAYDNIVELQSQASQQKQGRKGLKHGCAANVLDATTILKQCWDALCQFLGKSHSVTVGHEIALTFTISLIRPFGYKTAHMVVL